ncbi:MAG: hypothetical protein QG597_4288 [Actinomycetota bacterium]|nr:hypothetical protein [Actinomycetota bacterium]
MAAVAQNRIARTLAEELGLAKVRSILAVARCSTRQSVAAEVCEQFGFRDQRGRLQISTCLTGLGRLEQAGLIGLPASRTRGGWERRPRGTGKPPALPRDVPDEAGAVRGLELRLVDNEADSRLWNELLLREHPQGDRIITGRQLRYLVWSDHGLLGALGVSASALHLEARDRWIGWDWDVRQKYLDRVICLSRLLVRPGVQCRNLASKVLGLFVGRVGTDFQRRYNYRPWLIESFVDTAQHSGTCYRAANWRRVGRSKGRGRYDRDRQVAEGTKDIYLYCLDADFRSHMGLADDAGAVALEPAEGLDGDQWAEKEFGQAPLGDRRLSTRLVSIARLKARNPTEPFVECANGEAAQMQGYYRFIEHPDGEAVSLETILEPHRQRTIKRMRNETRVLCPQDSTVLEFSALQGCAGLGPTGANKSGTKGRGLRLHSTLALTASGLPLGILAGECVARQFYPKQSREQRRKLPFEQKEGRRWLDSILACEQAAEQLPGTHLVCIMDREADIFELFDHWQKSRKVDLLVRVAWNRASDVAESLFEEIRQAPVRQTVRLAIPGRRNRKSRLVNPYADLEIRFQAVNLQVPKHKRSLGASPVPLWVVYACEANPPPNTEPIKWLLFSTEKVESTEKAVQCVREYAHRWRIEEWHKVLKSGCKIEDIIATDAEAIRRVVAISMVVAWRVMLMTLLGREQPNLPPQFLFSDIELQVLSRFAQVEGYAPPDTVAGAVLLTARLGGYRARKGDLPPGVIVLWRGSRKLGDMARGAALFTGYDSS